MRDGESDIQGSLKQRILAGRNTIKYDSNILRGREMLRRAKKGIPRYMDLYSIHGISTYNLV